MSASFLDLYLLTLPTLRFLEWTQDANGAVEFGCGFSMFLVAIPFLSEQIKRRNIKMLSHVNNVWLQEWGLDLEG
jgi:hypothetical protein